jgi:hypothetical protein
MVYFIKDISVYQSAIRRDIHQNAHFLKETKQKCRGKIIIPALNYTESILATVSPLQMPDYSELQRIYFFDADVMRIGKNYNAYLNKECHCESGDYIAFMDFLYSQKDKVVFISDSSRISLIRNYCSIVRKREYYFEVTDSIATNANPAYIWRFKR